MGYTVLHLEKAKGNDAGMSAHIERTIHPKNADESRTHLNKELIKFPEGVETRTQAIQHRLDTANLKRKIGTNQVRAIRIMLSGTPEDMQQIAQFGKLDNWCNENLDWLKQTFGEKNLVSAVIHLDEKTPHIHATIVPIVTGERRKAKQEQQSGKKKYKKKNTESARLCADDVMARDKLKAYQDNYAERMQKYGLQRGIEGSEARHVGTSTFYRDLHLQNESLQNNIGNLLKQEDEARQELSRIKGEIKTDKLKSSAVDMATSAIEGISSVFGSSKVKRQQQEIEELKTKNSSLHVEIKLLKVQSLEAEREHTRVTDKLRQELKKIYELFPNIRELFRIENLCKRIGFSEELTKMILTMKPIGFNGKLHSPESGRSFKTEHSEVKIEEDPVQKGKLRLLIDNLTHSDWFRQKQQEFLETIGVKQKTGMKNRPGMKM